MANGYRVTRLQAENVKKLVAVDITPGPDGKIVLGGRNAQGKSSVLDALYMALGGLDAAPPRPVRAGQERAVIKVGLGREADAELTVLRTFDADGTTSLKVETADGAKYGAPQKMLDDLLGRITMDPLAFERMDPKAQAAELRRMVPLSVDLDALAKADAADMLARRDINRDVASAKARAEAITVVEGLPDVAPDRAAIVEALGKAADTNTAIERERAERADTARVVQGRRDHGAGLRAQAEAAKRNARKC